MRCPSSTDSTASSDQTIESQIHTARPATPPRNASWSRARAGRDSPSRTTAATSQTADERPPAPRGREVAAVGCGERGQAERRCRSRARPPGCGSARGRAAAGTAASAIGPDHRRAHLLQSVAAALGGNQPAPGAAGRYGLARWQRGQNQVPRPAARIFAISVPQREQGSPSRPYASNSSCIAPAVAVRRPVVAQRRALAGDPELERGADARVQTTDLGPRQARPPGRSGWIRARQRASST